MTNRFHATEEITVDQCLCTTGNPNSVCPYMTKEDFFAEKEPVDSLEEGHSDMLL